MTVPPDATHEWTSATSNGWMSGRRYYKFQDGDWFSYSPPLNEWFHTNNGPEWFAGEIIQGFFKEIDVKVRRETTTPNR